MLINHLYCRRCRWSGSKEGEIGGVLSRLHQADATVLCEVVRMIFGYDWQILSSHLDGYLGKLFWTGYNLTSPYTLNWWRNSFSMEARVQPLNQLVTQ